MLYKLEMDELLLILSRKLFRHKYLIDIKFNNDHLSWISFSEDKYYIWNIAVMRYILIYK